MNHGLLASPLVADPGVSARARWVAPELAMTLAIFTLVYCLTFFRGGEKLFRDSDTGWHIRAGERILGGAGLQRTDPYSFSMAGEPWLAWEWGADALMGAVHRAGGLRGIALLYAVAIAAATWLWVRLSWAAGANFLFTCALMSPMLSTASLHWLARPHVFGWLLLVGWILLLERGRVHPIASLAVGTVWANLHGSFFLAPLIAVIYAVARWLSPRIWKLDAEPVRPFVITALAAAAGTFANPYGWNLHRHVARYLTDWELLSRVGEFQSFNFHVDGAWQIVTTMAVGAAGAVAALSQRRLAHFALSAFLLTGALRSARGLPLAALVVLPLAAGAITASLRGAAGLAPRLGRILGSVLDYGDRLRVLDRSLRGWALAPVAAVAGWLLLGVMPLGFPRDQFPVAAAERVDALPPQARLLAPDKYGGYLIYRFDGRRRVFFDGRSDFYGAAFMKDYIRLIEVRPGWREILARFSFTHALLPADGSLAAALEQSGWRRLYGDQTAVLLAH